MARSVVVSTASWTQISSAVVAALITQIFGKANLLVNETADDDSAIWVGPSEADSAIYQTEAKDLFIRSDSETPWILILETAG